MNNEKKINIYTLNGYKNYGNRLQLFALSSVIKQYEMNALVYWPITRKERIKNIVKRTILKRKYKKEYKFYRFTKKYLPKRTDNIMPIGIYGSDQIWNSNYYDKRPYLLNIWRGLTKISYAASIGKEIISKKERQLFADALETYDAVSVREQSAKDLLQPLTDKRIEVVLDPTLLLDREEYQQLEKKPKDLTENEKYILCYILGNRDHEEKIEKFAKEKGYKTIYFSDKRDSSYGIEEFLYLIHRAQLICTDSFHACVFSFIFERPFVAFKRTGEANYMYTRLQNLIETFNLKNREFNGKEITKENLEVDYTEAKKILKKEQKKSLDFLKRALDIKDEN